MADNSTQAYLEKQDTVVYVECIYGPLSIVMTLFTNCIFLTYEFNRRSRTNTSTINVPRKLILYLSSADTAAILLGYLPVWMWTVLRGTSVITYLHCVCAYCLSSCFNLSQCLIVLISIEQFASICRPYHYVGHCSTTVLRSCVLCVAGYSMGAGILPLLNALGHLSKDVPYVLLFSAYASEHYDYMIIGQEFVLVAALLFCNIRVIRTLKTMETNVAISCVNDRKEHLRQLDLLHGTGREVSRMMVTVSLVFLACCMPNLVRVLFRRLNTRFYPLMSYVTWRLSLMTGVFNPFLYCLLRKRFRQTFREQFRKLFLCCKQNQIEDIRIEQDKFGV